MKNKILSLLSGKNKTEDSIDEKKLKRNFEIFKYDGIKALNIGKIKYAVLCFEKALHIREDITVLNYLALAYKAEDYKEDAISIYTKLIGIEPENKINFLNRATLLYQLNHYDEAIRDCQDALKIDENDTTVLLTIAKAYRAINQPENAIIHLSSAIETDPEYIDAYLLRSEIYFEQKEHHNKVSADIRKILKISPDNESAILLRAKINKMKNKIDEALDDYDHIIEINPFNEQAYAEKGKTLLEHSRADEAILLLDEAIDTNPESYIIWATRGEVKKHIGDLEGSEEDFRKSKEIVEFAEEYSSTPDDYSGIYKNPI